MGLIYFVKPFKSTTERSEVAYYGNPDSDYGNAEDGAAGVTIAPGRRTPGAASADKVLKKRKRPRAGIFTLISYHVEFIFFSVKTFGAEY